MTARLRIPAAIGAVAVAGLLLSACSSSGGGGGTNTPANSDPAASGTSPAGNATDALGTPNAASGSPIVFGLLNIESGPVTFPEVREAEQAAVQYVNAYKGGIGGRPIKLVTCVTDGQPSTSQRCANQIADQHPVAILGGADTGAPGAIPVWTRKNLAYLGGV